jgi:anaerobic selenocysteine-containing dehydrogenase
VADVRTVKSFCRTCTAICGILVDVDDETDEVLRVRGDADHPFSHGYTCAKGRALPQIHHHRDRIERPMMRIDGQLQHTTWEAALDDLADRLRSIIDEHGPASVGVYHGHHGANVNLLSDKDVIDPVTGMVRYSGIPISVEPALT